MALVWLRGLKKKKVTTVGCLVGFPGGSGRGQGNVAGTHSCALRTGGQGFGPQGLHGRV